MANAKKPSAPESIMSREEKREYVKALIENLESQKNATLLRITFAVGFLALFVNGIVFAEVQHDWPPFPKALLRAAISGVALSGTLYFVWFSQLHRLMVRTLDLLVTLDIEGARRVHYPGEEYWRRWWWVNYAAALALVVGLASCVAFLYTQIA